MATLLHGDYLIVASTDRLETTGGWTLWVGVYWSCNGEYQSKVLNSMADAFESKHEAEKFGLQMGKEWIRKSTPSPT